MRSVPYLPNSLNPDFFSPLDSYMDRASGESLEITQYLWELEYNVIHEFVVIIIGNEICYSSMIGDDPIMGISSFAVPQPPSRG